MAAAVPPAAALLLGERDGHRLTALRSLIDGCVSGSRFSAGARSQESQAMNGAPERVIRGGHVADGGWLQVLHSFPEPIHVAAGETLDIAVGHDRITLILLPLGEKRS